MPFLPPNCMVHDCLFIYIAAGRHIWRSFPYPPPGDAADSLQQGPKLKMKITDNAGDRNLWINVKKLNILNIVLEAKSHLKLQNYFEAQRLRIFEYRPTT